MVAYAPPVTRAIFFKHHQDAEWFVMCAEALYPDLPARVTPAHSPTDGTIWAVQVDGVTPRELRAIEDEYHRL